MTDANVLNRIGVTDAQMQEDLVEAWREAMRIRESEPDDALTMREICTQVFGRDETEYHLKRSREIVNEWMKEGRVEPCRVKSTSVCGYDITVPGYRLLDEGKTEREA